MKGTTQKVLLSERVLWVANTLFHQTFAVVTIYIFWVMFDTFKLSSGTSQHAVLSTIAYLPLMGEAIILFATDNVWSLKMERTVKYWIHGLVLFVSCGLLTAGIALMIHQNGGRKHFQSIHGWTGFVSWIFIIVSQVLGFAAAKAQSLSNIIRPIYIKALHNILGLLGYVFGIVSLAYGLKTRSFTSNSSEDSRVAAFWLLGVTTAWCVFGGLKSFATQIKTIFS